MKEENAGKMPVKYKNYMTRVFRVDLHMRLKQLAATRCDKMENIFNQVVEAGLDVVEGKSRIGLK